MRSRSNLRSPTTDVGAARGRRGHQQPRLFGQVLHVAVEQQTWVKSPTEHRAEPGADGVPFSAVGAMRDHLGACRARTFGRPIGRSIVDDDHVIDRSRTPSTAEIVLASLNAGDDGRGAESHCVSVSRDGDQRPRAGASLSSSAGSTSTDAAASATTLTADTTPIERSGG